jgi:two-component system OmpR family sensor kinase
VSLRSRLLAALCTVTLVALLVADVATYSALRNFLYSRIDQSLASVAAVVGQGLHDPGQQPPQGAVTTPGAGQGADGSPVTPTPGALHGAAGTSVELRSASGQVRFTQPAYQPGGGSYSPVLPTHVEGLSAGGAEGQGGGPGGAAAPEAIFTAPSTKAGGPEFRVLAVEQPDGDVLFVGSSLAPTEATLNRLLLIELAVTGAALVAAALLGFWLVRVGLRPLRDVETTADSIAAGNLDQRVPGANETTEVGRLATALNVMLGEIEQAFATRDATEAELRRSEEMLRRFVADASHELRTPLAAVSAYAELFERGAKDHPEDLERVMVGIRAETGRMRRLVEDLLLLARFDEGANNLAREPVELVNLATEVTRTAATVGPAWPVEVRAEQPVEVLGDEGRLNQVLTNLLANVRSHTPPGTRTTLTVGVDGPEAVVTVADDGPGFGPDHGAKIFERFYRADASRSRAQGGAGLGLSIVAAIVTAHGGRVEAGEAPGGGALVAVHLPLARPAARPSGSGASGAGATAELPSGAVVR